MVSKTKKPAKKTLKKMNLKRPGQLAVIILLVIVVGFVVKQQMQINQDRQLFKQAEAKTEDVYKQIVGIIGEPDKVVREKSCGRANLKFDEGPLMCNTSLHILLSSRSIDSVNSMLEKAAKINSSPLRSASATTSSFSAFRILGNNSTQEFHQKISSIDSLSCSLSYEYPVNDKSAYYDLLEPETPENLRIGVTCGGPAKTQHYPLRD